MLPSGGVSEEDALTSPFRDIKSGHHLSRWADASPPSMYASAIFFAVGSTVRPCRVKSGSATDDISIGLSCWCRERTAMDITGMLALSAALLLFLAACGEEPATPAATDESAPAAEGEAQTEGTSQ